MEIQKKIEALTPFQIEICDEISMRKPLSFEDVKIIFVNLKNSYDKTIKHIDNCIKKGLDPLEFNTK